MKNLIFLAAAVLILATASFSQDKGFGLGIMAGEPSGISAKLWISHSSAVDAGVAWSFMNDGSFHVHGDYIWHNFDLISPRVPFYIGAGGRIKFKNNKSLTDNRLGIRVPVGLDIFISEPTSDVFIEIVPILDLTPKTFMTLNGAVGFRYFFK